MENEDPDYLPDIQRHPNPHPEEDQPTPDDPPDLGPNRGITTNLMPKIVINVLFLSIL